MERSIDMGIKPQAHYLTPENIASLTDEEREDLKKKLMVAEYECNLKALNNQKEMLGGGASLILFIAGFAAGFVLATLKAAS